MIAIIVILLLWGVCLGYWLIDKNPIMSEPKDKYSEPEFSKKFYILVAGAILSVVIGLVQPYSLEIVQAGNLGIQVKLIGDERGVSDYVYKTGRVIYNSWTEKVYEYPTYQQHIEYENQMVITKGGFPANIKPTFNYNIKPDAIGEMFSELRLDIREIEKGWLMTAIVGSVNDVANTWEVDSIFNNREKFETAIVNECNKRVSKWFTVSQLRTNIVPPEALKEAIINKTKAIQEAQAKMQEALVAEANAQKLIATAKGDSAEMVITAAGQAQADVIEAKGIAEAMRLKQKELSPLYVEYLKAQAWNGALPTTVLGSNSQTLFNLK